MIVIIRIKFDKKIITHSVQNTVPFESCERVQVLRAPFASVPAARCWQHTRTTAEACRRGEVERKGTAIHSWRFAGNSLQWNVLSTLNKFGCYQLFQVSVWASCCCCCCSSPFVVLSLFFWVFVIFCPFHYSWGVRFWVSHLGFMSIPLAVQHDQHICICMSHFHEHWSWISNTRRQRAQHQDSFQVHELGSKTKSKTSTEKTEKTWMKNNEHSAAEWTEPTPLCCLVFDDVFVTYLQWFQVAPDAKFGDSQRVTAPPPKIAVKLGAGEGTATSAPGLCPSTCSFRLFTFADTTSKYIRSFRRFRLGSIVLCCCVPMWFSWCVAGHRLAVRALNFLGKQLCPAPEECEEPG